MKITAHCLVKNEERFVWYSIMSVTPYVDEVMVWDMGSRDKTVGILEALLEDPRTKGKIKLKKLKSQNFFDEPKIRQQMLDETKSDWFIVVDGDEIWWHDSIKRVVDTIKQKGHEIESIVVPTVNLVGDMFHFQDEKAGHYHLAGRVGHLNLRAIKRTVPGLHSAKPHGLWGWVDSKDRMIQDRDKEKIVFVDAPYLHATHLQRSGSVILDREVFKRAFKLKHELGIPFPGDYFFPESFFLDRPKIVPFVWKPMTFGFWLRSLIETPLRKIKRSLLPVKEGY